MGIEMVVLISSMIVGLLEIGFSIPLILEKVPLNPLYGFRIKKTLSNESVWYKANKYVGRDFLVASLILLVGTLMLSIFINELPSSTIIWSCLALTIIPLPIVIARGFSYLNKL